MLTSSTNEPKTVVTIQMPADAAERLIAKYKADPEGAKKEFKDIAGFDLVDIRPAIEEHDEHKS